MSIISLLLASLFTVIAVSYAWGIRGDLIGGEEGAMLPGALLGLGVSLFMGRTEPDVVFFMMGFGMVGMFFGGTEPYAQTLEMMRWGDGGEPKSENLKKGVTGLLVKGAPWFGICAGIMGIGMNSLAGKIYRWYELIAIAIVLPALRYAGIRLLNTPYNPKKGRFPKIYFSKDKREEWGGLWFMLLGILAFSFVKHDRIGFTMTFFGAVGGSFGWVAAELLDCVTSARLKNGKYVFGKLQEKGKIDNWKLMEFAYGAFGSAAVVAGVIFNLPLIRRYAAAMGQNGVYCLINLQHGYYVSMGVTAFVSVLLILNPILSHFVRHKYRNIRKVIHKCHRPVICYIPMFMLLMRDFRIARIMIIVILPFLALEELVFVNMRHKTKSKTSVQETFSIMALIVGLLAVFLYNTRSILIIAVYAWIFAVYFVTCCLASFNTQRKKTGQRRATPSVLLWDMPSFKTVKGYYVVCFVISAALYYLCTR